MLPMLHDNLNGALSRALGRSPAELAPAPTALVPAVRPSTTVARPGDDDPFPNGDRELRDTRKFLRYFAHWRSEAEVTVATCALAAMNAKDPETKDPVWEYAFKVLITGEYGAGKSWVAKLMSSLTPDPVVLLEPTKPALMDEIGDQHTVVITEVDELLATAGRNRGIVATMNAMYEPGRFHIRKQGGKVLHIHVFNHMLLDGNDDVFRQTRPDTRALMSRCIVVRAEMAPPGYRRPMWDGQARAAAERGQGRLAKWMTAEVAAGMGSSLDELAKVPVEIGAGNPRRTVLYEPLFTVAERADRYRADRGDDDHYWTGVLTEAAIQLETAPITDKTEDPSVAEFMASIPDVPVGEGLL